MTPFAWPSSAGAPRALACPEPLAELMRAFVVEEATSAMRHDVRNKLATVRNGAFFIRQKLKGQPVMAAEPRLEKFLQLIDDELDALGGRLTSRLPTPEDVNGAPVALSDVREQLLAGLQLPEGTQVKSSGRNADAARAHPAELALALFCLLENAVESVQASAQRAIRIDLVREGADACLSVDDGGAGFEDPEAALKPFHSTKPGRMGMGLKIAKRVASRWGGKLVLGKSDLGGAQVALHLPAA